MSCLVLVPLLVSVWGPAAQATPVVDPGVWTIHPTILANDTSASFAPNGPGSLSVAWDARLRRFVAVFEYQVAPADATCPHGYWGLGAARSVDGFTWTNWRELYEPDPAQDAGMPFSCVMAHPSFSWGVITGPQAYRRAIVNFKAENEAAPYYTGINYIQLTFSNPGVPQLTGGLTPANVINITQQFGMQNVLQLDATRFTMLLQIGAHLYQTTSSGASVLLASSWSAPQPVMYHDPLVAWQRDELIGPELTCLDDGTVRALLGGRDSQGGLVVNGGLAFADDDGSGWVVDQNTQATWTTNDDMRHWSTLLVSNGNGDYDYVVWYVEKDAVTGHTQWRVMYTTAPNGVMNNATGNNWSPLRNNRCP